MKALIKVALAITVCAFSGCNTISVHEARMCHTVQQMMLADMQQKKTLPAPSSPAPIRVVFKND